MEVRGVFSTYKLTDTEKDTFAEYLQHSMNNPVLEFVKYLLGDDYLRFIDIMSGTTFKVPSSKTLERDLEAVRIYLIVKKFGFTEDAVRAAGKSFNRTMLAARKSCYRVSKVLGVEDTLEGDNLNNFLLYIKYPEEGIDVKRKYIEEKDNDEL